VVGCKVQKTSPSEKRDLLVVHTPPQTTLSSFLSPLSLSHISPFLQYSNPYISTRKFSQILACQLGENSTNPYGHMPPQATTQQSLVADSDRRPNPTLHGGDLGGHARQIAPVPSHNRANLKAPIMAMIHSESDPGLQCCTSRRDGVFDGQYPTVFSSTSLTGVSFIVMNQATSSYISRFYLWCTKGRGTSSQLQPKSSTHHTR